jgi:hypothetical protein
MTTCRSLWWCVSGADLRYLLWQASWSACRVRRAVALAVALALARILALTAADRWNFLVAFALALVRATEDALLVVCFFGAVVFFLVAGRVVFRLTGFATA